MESYKVDDKGFKSYSDAVAYAASVNANVVDTSNGLIRWFPPPPKKTNRVKHILVNADGSTTLISKVRR